LARTAPPFGIKSLLSALHGFPPGEIPMGKCVVISGCVLAALLAWGGVTVSVRAVDPTREGVEFFEGEIRPLVVVDCFKCHGRDTKPKANRSPDSRAAMLKGGDTGPAVLPRAPAKSLLLKAIGYKDPDLSTPPRGKLTAEQVADVAAWVKMGAPCPDDAVVK